MSQINAELYQQVILEHNKNPRNYRKIEQPTCCSEGFNPLCGDHYWVYVNLDDKDTITEVTFEGDGCAISKASASMMTATLKGKTLSEARAIVHEFIQLIKGEIPADTNQNKLGRLNIFSGIWKYPSRVKCAILAWHTVNGAFDKKQQVSSE